jgi:hypothetical protein
MIRKLLLTIFGLFTVSATITVAIGAFSVTKVQQSPREAVVSLMRQFTEAEVELNSDKFAALNEHSSEYCVYTDNNRVLSYDTMVKMNRTVFHRLTRMEFELDTLHVRVLSPEMAVAFGPFHQALTDSSGMTLRFKGEGLWIARNTNGQWKFIFAQAFHHPDKSSR